MWREDSLKQTLYTDGTIKLSDLLQDVPWPHLSNTETATLPSNLELIELDSKYSGRLLFCRAENFPSVDIYLCGTLHVSKRSAEMVKDVIQTILPNYVVLELCEERADSLVTSEKLNVTLASVCGCAFKDKSFITLGSGLLAWMQSKAAEVGDCL